jgi:predicted transcriptional regulator
MNQYLSISQIREWLVFHQKRKHLGDDVPFISAIASRAGISRQTLYAVLRGKRSEFGEVAQIRLSRVIQQISSEPSYQQSRIAKIDLSGDMPRISFGL